MDEFQLIRKYFVTARQSETVAVGIGDDCAVLVPPRGQRLVSSIDTQVSGVHFPEHTRPDKIAARALHCAVSDLAAMGAEPLWFSLAITLPTIDEGWLEEFSRGLFEAAELYQIQLIGGDTTKGSLAISLHVQGAVPEQHVLLRSGAQVGDQIFVSGSLGDAAAGLAVIEKRLDTDERSADFLKFRFYSPQARVRLGLLLRYIATSCIDVSDGLLADLGHICEASGVGAVLDSRKLPLSPALLASVPPRQALDWALSGGDDYQLCFSVSADQAEELKAKAKKQSIDVNCIGEIVEGEGISDLTSRRSFSAEQPGYRHF